MLSTSAARDGTSVTAVASAASWARSMAPRALAVAITKQASVASWQVKALVEATPISGPAWVMSTVSASRDRVLSAALTMPSRCWPRALQKRSAARVSAVSPDCEMKSASPPSSRGGSR